MDSMMAVTLKRQIESDFDCALPRTVAFEYPTINALSGLLVTKVVTTVAGYEAAGPTAMAPQLQPLSIRSPATRPGTNGSKPARFAKALPSDIEAMLDRKLEELRAKRR
jgi:hypothetical protein